MTLLENLATIGVWSAVLLVFIYYRLRIPKKRDQLKVPVTAHVPRLEAAAITQGAGSQPHEYASRKGT
jgi:hypothetical protein